MKIQWMVEGNRRWLAVVVALAAAVPQLFFKRALPPDYPFAYLALLAAALGAFALLVFFTRVEIDRWWGILIEQVCVAGAAALILHLPMFQHARVSPEAIVITTCIGLTLGLAFFCLLGSGKWFGALWMTVCWIYGIVTVEVYAFTGNMITLSQILSVQTGIEVMENYRFVLAPFIISSTILYACAMFALLRIREKDLGRLRLRAMALGCAALAALLPLDTFRTRKSTTYQDNCLRSFGIPMELLLELKSFRVEPPEDYSTQMVERMDEEYGEDAQVADADKPHVIAIMLEAFSDLNVLGDFSVSADPLEFTRSLWSESIHGNFLASTLAGGTSRTEWEFLTGNSMYFMPASSIPFRQYMGDEENGIVGVFQNEGYHTIGLHPFDRYGWDRYEVYPALGFDEYYFEDDLEWDGRLRRYVSDSAFVHKVIELFEAREPGKPLFMFGVTMQNHGGYTDESLAPEVRVEGLDVDCSQEDQYLTLVRYTDDALRELIEYFRGVDEKVEIVFFGDHQPGLTDAFYDAVGVKDAGMKYIVPYVIWKNYDSSAEETELTSANYLAARMLQEAGLPLPPYFDFLSELSDTIPAICAFGYSYEGNISLRDEVVDERSEELLDEYECYQYGNMFDDNVDSDLFEGEPAP